MAEWIDSFDLTLKEPLMIHTLEKLIHFSFSKTQSIPAWIVLQSFMLHLSPPICFSQQFGLKSPVDYAFNQPSDALALSLKVLGLVNVVNESTIANTRLNYYFMSLYDFLKGQIIKCDRIFEQLCLGLDSVFQNLRPSDALVDAILDSKLLISVPLLFTIPENSKYLNKYPQFIRRVSQLLAYIIAYDARLARQFFSHQGAFAWIRMGEHLNNWNLVTGVYMESFFEQDGPRVIQNESIVVLMAHFKTFPFSNQVYILKKFKEYCNPNQYHMMHHLNQSGLTEWLIDNLLALESGFPLEEGLHLLELLLKFETKSSDLKKLLMAMKPTKTDKGQLALPWHHDMILKLLNDVANVPKTQLHSNFFIRNHKNWSFDIPTLSNWPESSQRGYSVAFQINGDFQEHSLVCICCIHFGINDFLKFLGVNGKLKITFQKGELVHHIEVKDFCMTRENWYSVAFTHHSGIFNAGTAICYVDGYQAWRGSFPFPSESDSTIVISSATHSLDDPAVALPGQFGSFALFDYAMSAEQLQTSLFERHSSFPIPNVLYYYQLLPTHQQPVLFLHPLGHVSGTECFNISTHEKFGHLKPMALNGLIPISTISFSTSIECLGGLDILYPILSHVCIHQATLNHDVVFESQKERAYWAMKLIVSLLSNNSSLIHYFVDSNGPRLLSLLLQRLPSDAISMDLFEIILQLRNVNLFDLGIRFFSRFSEQC